MKSSDSHKFLEYEQKNVNTFICLSLLRDSIYNLWWAVQWVARYT